MTIGFSPFLTADVDEVTCAAGQWGQPFGAAAEGEASAARLELIRRRVVQGYYSSPLMAAETARRILDSESLETR